MPSQTPRSKPTSMTTSTAAAENPSVTGVAFRVGFTGRVISNTLGGKRKRVRPSASSSTSSLVGDVSSEGPQAGTSKLDATPNPKPRKQSKRTVSFTSPSRQSTPQPTTPTKQSRTRGSVSPTKKLLLVSPHANNPAADYILPVLSFSRDHTSSRSRSTTPIPPYEPPSEKFTPPREVIVSPITATHTPNAKRKPAAKNTGKAKKLVLQIKKEFPDDVDLSAPLPPPSPTEDPLLLRGPASMHRRRRPRASSHPLEASVYSRDTPPIASTSPIRGPDMDRTRLLDLNFDSVMDMTSDDTMGAPPAFDFSAGNDGGDDWSDDDRNSDQAFDQSGEFTGKFKVVKVPTKEDPPSSGTKERMEAWGRPISPFPCIIDVDKEGSPKPALQETSQAVSRRSVSPAEFITGSSRAADLFSPRPSDQFPSATQSRKSPPPQSPIESRESPLPPSDDEESSQEDASKPRGPFDFDAIDDSIRPNDDLSDDDLYADHFIPVQDSSVDNISLDERPVPDDESSDLLAHEDLVLSDLETTHVEPTPLDQDQIDHRSLQPPESTNPERRSPTPAESVQRLYQDPEIQPEFTSPSAHYGSVEYRSPQVALDAEGSEDEEEDEVSIVRELSQPPDFDDEDLSTEQVAHSFAQVSLLSSPNPFDVDAQSISFQSSVRRPRGSLVAERSKVYEQSPSEPVAEYALSDSEDELENMDSRVIKITSEDPMAAARAAAILRLVRNFLPPSKPF